MNTTPIQTKYVEVKLKHPEIGSPTTTEIPGKDGGAYQHFSGGFTITYHPTAGAHYVCGKIRDKWLKIGAEHGPNGYPTTDELDAASGRGRFNNFQQGTIIYRWNTYEAFSVFGEIYNKWGEYGYDRGWLKFPLMDEAPTAGNTGIFADFEVGAIYYVHAAKKAYIVKSPVLEAWASRGRDTGELGLPMEDTKTIALGKFSQKFQCKKERLPSKTFTCELRDSKSLYSNVINTRMKPVSNSAIQEHTQDALNPEFKLTFLNEHLRLRTCMVIFSGSYTRAWGAPSFIPDSLTDQYRKFADELDHYTSGLCRVDREVFVITHTLARSEFKNYVPKDYDSKFDYSKEHKEFNSYDRVTNCLAYHGRTPADYDVISIVLPWQNTGNDVRSGVAWANVEEDHKFNDSTWNTVHNVVPSDEGVLWTQFLHEHSHILYWIMKKHGHMFEDLGPDHEYWRNTYPVLSGNGKYSSFDSNYEPKPVNYSPLGIGDFLLYPILNRIKTRLYDATLPVLNPHTGTYVKWGTWTKETAQTGYGRATLLLYASPDVDLLIERAVAVKETYGEH